MQPDGSPGALEGHGDEGALSAAGAAVTERRMTGRRCAAVGVAAVAAVIALAVTVEGGVHRRDGVVHAAASPATKVVAYHGVEIRVPVDWPVLGGNTTPTCFAPWPAQPTVYVGPQPDVPGCPGPDATPGDRSSLDGVWLQAGSPGPDAGRVTTNSAGGARVAGSTDPGLEAEDHGVDIEIGAATPRPVADRLLRSLAYRPRAPDTTAADSCRTDQDPAEPSPVRLARALSLAHGTIVLQPPTATDEPTVAARIAWPTGSAAQATDEGYDAWHLYLARIDSAYPATVVGGSERPEVHDVLAWVLYGVPLSPGVADCGLWSVTAYDAHTGAGLVETGYAPGP